MIDKQTILITGATGNIGGGAATALTKRGARIVLLGRTQQKLEVRADSIRKNLTEAGIAYLDEDICTLVIDFTDMQSIRNAAAEALDRFPVIDGLILSAVALVQNGPNILPNGHELMFATNVLGPFLFTELLVEKLQKSNALVLHVVTPFYEEIIWDDIESIQDHKTGKAYNRTKTMNRMITAEAARQYGQKISFAAFDPSFIIDKNDPELEKRWPAGLMGYFWRVMTVLLAKPPAVAGEPIADLMLNHPDRHALNGALYKLSKRIPKRDKAMNDETSGKRLWNILASMTELSST